MSAEGWLAAGYALLMWAAAWGLRTHAGKPKRTWVGTGTVDFARTIALVPLAVADLVLLRAAVLERSAVALFILTLLFFGITRFGWREISSRHISR